MTYNVVIADDEAAERDGMEFLLQQRAFPMRIRKCANGADALEELKKSPADLLITDIKMPFMGGLELCEKAKKLNPDTLLLISSAYSDFEYMQRAIMFKVEAYILKPVVVEDFYAVMERSLAALENRARLEQNRRHLLEEYRTADSRQREKLLPILLDKAPYREGASPEKAAESAVITRVTALIEENYQKDIGLEWAAGQVYLSPGYLSGLFKRETGKSIVQYITFLRMEKAKELLTHTNIKIVDISQKVGYNNASYFCLLFRKYYGITPNQMREQEEVR